MGEVAHGLVESLTAAEIRGDRDPVPRPGVAARERLAAQRRVELQSLAVHALDLGRSLAVPELAHVEVPRLPVHDPAAADPAEQDVAGRLHQALPLHDPAALVAVAHPTREWRDHGGPGLLDLEEERVVPVSAQ